MIVSVDWFVVVIARHEENNPALFFLRILLGSFIFGLQNQKHTSPIYIMVPWRTILKLNLFVLVAAAALSLVLFR